MAVKENFKAMPKARKKKQPITNHPNTGSFSSKRTRTVIRRFHTIIKRKTQLEKLSVRSAKDEQELDALQLEMEQMGGLERYQQMSATGQSNERGGGSERVLLKFLKDLGLDKTSNILSLLDVGALKPNNYKGVNWIKATPMDLNSRHPDIIQQDFLTIDKETNHLEWNIISLSLVVNFVPDAKDRGRMLDLAHALLAPKGFLFLVLPLPCVLNSRYVTPEHLTALMTAVGFNQLHQKWTPTGRMAYWLFQKSEENLSKRDARKEFSRKVVLRQGNRNNFHILLPSL